MTVTADREETVVPPSAGDGGSSRLRTALLAVIAVGLLLLGGGSAVALGIGSDRPPGGDSVDAGFARDMSAHHLQAVEMANLAQARSGDPEVRGLGFDIAESQQNQVGRMQGWLSLWGLSITGGDRMAWMSGGEHVDHGTGAVSGAEMPGMAGDEELAQLRTSSGEQFDVLFLQLMARHHQGGHDMAAHAVEHASEPAVRTLARTIVESQSAEVALMTGMLAERGAEPLPAP